VALKSIFTTQLLPTATLPTQVTAGNPERATDSDVVDFQRCITTLSEVELVVVRSKAL
jgi:hypothetical protein